MFYLNGYHPLLHTIGQTAKEINMKYSATLKIQYDKQNVVITIKFDYTVYLNLKKYKI